MRHGADRGAWASAVGFVLAAAGSAVGLGNVWRFPYIAGENGGGLFVLIYLACIVLVGLPVMIGEIMVGRAAQTSTVSAFKLLAGERSPWVSLGWLGVVAAFLILSFYAVVAGWALHYTFLSLRGAIAGRGPEEIQLLFTTLHGDAGLSLLWLALFMVLTVAVVLGGVRDGLERWSRILMPALFLMLVGLLVHATTLESFPAALTFVFGLHAERLTAGGVLEALGHSFFTLSVGMGGMLTYGSYLSHRADVPGNSVAIALLDTVIALLACLVLFPIVFSAGLEPAQGPGLIFANLPIAFAQLPGGSLLASIFFALLVFAALTSSISLLEVATAYFIDDRGWTRRRATWVAGGSITLLGVPAALTGATRLFGTGLAELVGKNWFDLVADFSSNWMLPAGGMGLALFVGWRLTDAERRREFAAGSRFGRVYAAWLLVLRWVAPAAILAVFLHLLGIL